MIETKFFVVYHKLMSNIINAELQVDVFEPIVLNMFAIAYICDNYEHRDGKYIFYEITRLLRRNYRYGKIADFIDELISYIDVNNMQFIISDAILEMADKDITHKMTYLRPILYKYVDSAPFQRINILCELLK